MASTRKRAPRAHERLPAGARTRARRASRRAAPRARLGAARRGLPRLPVLDQRQRDVLGLALVALGVFMGFVLYGSAAERGGARRPRAWRWRSAGRSAARACSRPSPLVLGGGALLLRPVLPALRPLRTGAAVPVRRA